MTTQKEIPIRARLGEWKPEKESENGSLLRKQRKSCFQRLEQRTIFKRMDTDRSFQRVNQKQGSGPYGLCQLKLIQSRDIHGKGRVSVALRSLFVYFSPTSISVSRAQFYSLLSSCSHCFHPLISDHQPLPERNVPGCLHLNFIAK